MYQAIVDVEEQHLKDVMAHFQKVLSPEALDLLVDHLIGVVRQEDDGTRDRAMAALGLLAPAAIFPLSYHLIHTRSSTIGIRLIEALAVMFRTCAAPLPTLLRAAHAAKIPEIRDAARRVLMERGINVPPLTPEHAEQPALLSSK
jgi:hypothetical protein